MKKIKINSKALEVAVHKTNKLRLTDSIGRKENPCETVQSVLKRGLRGMYDDDAIDYILHHAIQYYLEELQDGK